MPVKRHGREQEIEAERETLLEHVKWASKEEVVIVGGDFNAHIGGGEAKRGVCGRFGLRSSNEQGEELKGWCEENGLCWVNSFFSEKKRGTWWSNVGKKWYELDGFVMKCQERHVYAKKVKSVGEMVLSDHKPKKMVVNVKKKKTWRRRFEKKRTPTVKWEKLRDEETQRRYATEVDRKMRELESREKSTETTGWVDVQEIVMGVASEVCGVSERKVENPWMVGREEEVSRLRAEIGRWIERRDEAVEAQDEERREVARRELKAARKRWKKTVAGWEKEWWEEELRSCEDAAGRGDTGAVYRSLRKLGGRGVKQARAETTITTPEFREHFKRVSVERWENLPEDVQRVVDKAVDLRGDERTKRWRERLGRPPDRAEIEREMGKMREAAPGEDGVRLCFLMRG